MSPVTAYQARLEQDAGKVEIHEVRFERNVRDGMWRGICSCGWLRCGTEAEVKARAARHDLDWEPAQ